MQVTSKTGHKEQFTKKALKHESIRYYLPSRLLTKEVDTYHLRLTHPTIPSKNQNIINNISKTILQKCLKY